MNRLIIITAFYLFLTSCTTIKIKEGDVFDIKRTIHIESFSEMPYHPQEVKITPNDSIELESWFIDNPETDRLFCISEETVL